MNKALDFASWCSRRDCEVKTWAFQTPKKECNAVQLELLQMQTKAREYVCDVFRPVQGVWLSGKKSALLDGVKELVGLVEEMIKAESMEIGRCRLIDKGV